MSQFKALKEKTEKEQCISLFNCNFLCDTKYCRVHTACPVIKGTLEKCDIIVYGLGPDTDLRFLLPNYSHQFIDWLRISPVGHVEVYLKEICTDVHLSEFSESYSSLRLHWSHQWRCAVHGHLTSVLCRDWLSLSSCACPLTSVFE